MKIEWYQSRYLICPVCDGATVWKCSDTFFYLKDIKSWVKIHYEKCDATSFKEEGYVEVIE
jgi:hypothetical protein|tara:strand:- start:2660 stop:2842 length:183 start_codon:yes stop_codon:yes gene_type:complete